MTGRPLTLANGPRLNGEVLPHAIEGQGDAGTATAIVHSDCATLAAAADVLLRAGAASVSGLCFARTPADH